MELFQHPVSPNAEDVEEVNNDMVKEVPPSGGAFRAIWWKRWNNGDSEDLTESYDFIISSKYYVRKGIDEEFPAKLDRRSLCGEPDAMAVRP